MDISLEKRQVNGMFHHPFTMIVSGPSGTGKSTFVSDLLKRRYDFIDENLDYIYFLIGTSSKENPLFTQLASQLKEDHVPDVQIWELNNLFDTKKKLKEEFPSTLTSVLTKCYDAGKKGLIILDDLMQELSDNNFLMSAFTRLSTHYSLSVIYITQNLFFKGAGASHNVTIYRNCKHLVLFESRNDKTLLTFVGQKIGQGRKMRQFLEQVLDEYRFIVINFDLTRDKRCQFVTDIFKKDNLFKQVLPDVIVPHQTVLFPIGLSSF